MYTVAYTHHLSEQPVGIWGIDWVRSSFKVDDKASAEDAVRHLRITRRNGVGKNEYDGFVITN